MVKLLITIIPVFLLTSFVPAHSQTGGDNSLINLIEPDAIHLDIDGFRFITHGIVCIEKGNQQALIDTKGKFVVPWGKYKFEDYNHMLWGSLIKVETVDRRTTGFINLQGNIVIPLGTFYSFNHFGMAPISFQVGINAEFIDTNGVFYKGPFNYYTSDPPLHLREPYTKPQQSQRMLMLREVEAIQLLGPREYPADKIGHYGKTKDGKRAFIYKKKQYSYGNRAGKVLLAVDYDLAREFTDSLAGVMKIDEFGVQKWGFIDISGNLVIPLIFKNEPGYFHNGLALVEPTDKSEFQYAYIDKKGQIKIKIGDGEKTDHYVPLGASDGSKKEKLLNTSALIPDVTTTGYFVNGYAFWNKNVQPHVLDTNGHFATFEEFLGRPGLSSKFMRGNLGLNNFDDLGIYFTVKDVGFEIIDYKKKTLFAPFPGSYIADYYSPYAIATAKNNIEKNPQYGYGLNGIINNQGKFIIVKEKKSVW